MIRRSLLQILLGTVCTFAVVAVVQAEVTAERTQQGAVIKIDGKPFTEYLIQSGTKPILWPIIGPTGQPMTRSFPMAKLEGDKKEASDHPHHRSLWFTHGMVNGIDFWMEKKSEPRPSIKHREFVKVESGKSAVIVTRNDWLAADGKRVCEDERTFTFGTDGDARWIDCDIALKASDGPVKFGDTKEGAFGVRMAEPLRVDAKKGAHIVNSEGQTDGQTWGKPAAWVDYHGTLDGQAVGIAIFNHPSSFRYPTPWHVRTYGLFAANPFGLHDFAGKSSTADGTYTLPAGETLVLRYRVLLHRGDEKSAGIAKAFAEYAAQKK